MVTAIVMRKPPATGGPEGDIWRIPAGRKQTKFCRAQEKVIQTLSSDARTALSFSETGSLPAFPQPKLIQTRVLVKGERSKDSIF